MPAFHCFLPWSGAPIWAHCPGQPQMAALFPQEETDDTRKGEASHWYAEQRLRNAVSIPESAPNGIIFDDEIREAALEYVNDVRKRVAELHADEWNVEFFTRATFIHPDHAGGTVDAFAVSRAQKRLVTWNYKFGHKEVSEFENYQEIGYAAGLLEYLGVNGLTDQEWIVESRIVQPRCYTARHGVRPWIVRASDLRPYFNQLTERAIEAVGPNPRTISGSHCYYCAARHGCEASRKAAMASVEYVSKSVPEPLDAEGVSFELHTLERAESAIKGRLTMVREQAAMMLKNGKIVPGYSMQPSTGRLKWQQPLPVVKALGQMFNVPTTKEVTITPAQAIDAGLDESIVNQYAAREKSGMKLAVMDHSEIRRILSNVE